MELIVAVLLAFGFSLTNGFHDAANAIAALVATRAATPLAAIIMASVFNILGPLLLGAAVAETVGGIVQLSSTEAVEVIGAALTAAVAWNVFTWRMGLPSSSSHALIGGLVGAALVAGGTDAVNWGGFDGLKPTGVIGVLVVMAVSPVVGVAAGAAGELAGRRALRRATQAVNGPIKGGLWVTSASLAFSHGANDAAKTVGVVAALLVADDRISTLSDAPLWVRLGSALALTVGTAMGGWTIVRTIGRRIYRLRPLDGLVVSGGSAGVIFGASLLGAPVSTTQVVASSVVGTGIGRHRMKQVRWGVVSEIGLAWVTTLPVAAALAALLYPVWRWLGS
jgi:PiT family inorganic phosphate transporter